MPNTKLKFNEIITDDTKILTEFIDDSWKNNIFIPDSYFTDKYENIRVEAGNDFIICYKDNKPVALFNCYELKNLSLNGPRGLLRASGHETDHEYWFDNNEYICDHTR